MENTGLIVQQIIVWRFAVCPNSPDTLYCGSPK